MTESEAKQARAARAAERSKTMTGAVFSLGQEPSPRVDAMTPLERSNWAMTGAPWPKLPSAEWPIRVRTLAEK